MDKTKTFLVGVFLAFGICLGANAHTEILPPLTTFATIQGIDGMNAGKIGYYNNTNKFHWAVSNWGAPTNLKAKRFFTYDWSVNNNYSRVQHFNSIGGTNNVWELAQSNVTGPCNNEVDLFLGTDVLDQNKTLASMGELKFEVDLERTYTDVQYGCMGQGYWALS